MIQEKITKFLAKIPVYVLIPSKTPETTIDSKSCEIKDTKSMFTQGLVYKYRPYFENIGPNGSKLGSLVGQLILLRMVYFIFRKNLN